MLWDWLSYGSDLPPCPAPALYSELSWVLYLMALPLAFLLVPGEYSFLASVRLEVDLCWPSSRWFFISSLIRRLLFSAIFGFDVYLISSSPWRWPGPFRTSRKLMLLRCVGCFCWLLRGRPPSSGEPGG